MMQVPNKESRIGRGKERVAMALNIGPGGFTTYLSLQYNKVLLGTVIWFSHMALELGQLLCPLKERPVYGTQMTATGM
jgi:hypothetical protein